MTEESINAPSIDDLAQLLEQEQLQSIEAKQPTVAIVAAGGCGTNILKLFVAAKRKFDAPIKMSIIDTSMSNVNGVSPDIVIRAIGELGSGKDRGVNVDAITNYLDTHKSIWTDDAADINIILFSMAGGSGSVIAPLLMYRLMRHSNKAVIFVAVVDGSSKRDVENTIGTLKSISNICNSNNYYVPMMLYANTKAGKNAVNVSAVKRLIELVDMLTNKSVAELDYSDKMNYLRPTNVGCPSGCYLLQVSATEPDIDKIDRLPGELATFPRDDEKRHACLIINDSGMASDILADVAYPGWSDKVKYCSTVGAVVPTDIINDFKDRNERYQRIKSKTDQTLKMFDGNGDTSNSEIIL